MSKNKDFDCVEWAFRSAFARNAHRFTTSITLPNTEESWHYLTVALGDGAQLVGMQCLAVTILGDGVSLCNVDPDDTLALPALSQIKLVADGEMVDVVVEDLDSLMHKTLAIADGRTLLLELVNVSLTGDGDELGSRFEIVGTPKLQLTFYL